MYTFMVPARLMARTSDLRVQAAVCSATVHLAGVNDIPLSATFVRCYRYFFIRVQWSFLQHTSIIQGSIL